METTNNPTLDPARFDVRETIAAAGDYLASAFGKTILGRTLHPLAKSLDMAAVCYAYGVNNAKTGTAAGAAPISVMVSQGAASSAFQNLFRETTAPVVLRSYETAKQRPFAALLELQDFKPYPIFAFDLAHGLETVLESASVPRRIAFDASAVYSIAKLQTHAQIFTVGRDVLLSNDIKSLVNLLLGAGALAAQVEAGLLAAAVESSPVLSDGDVFDGSNSVALPLSAESLGTAFGMLRNQGAPGRPLNIAPRHLVVDPTLELQARMLIRHADLGGSVQLSVLPGLASGRWLVMGDPELVPSLTLVTLEGGPLSYQVQRSFKNDGMDIAVAMYESAMFVGRIGIVRGGA